ncbi:hypothetical protein CJ030_MR7G022872 [Morella rubra]|uniref:EF-hand domain-containing protein n=1 Tax=Morella rubra TaxID=262757 RepID=A0A6A1V8R4_9ROSI|nr:hypothetical protein CJ030_MR7G022872 [Morella rubra]
METPSGAHMKKSVEHGQVLDGSDIMELVENEEVFSNFVDLKFHELDRDRDGKLSVKELEPAVADIGAALGLPTQGASAESDHIYSEVMKNIVNNSIAILFDRDKLEQTLSSQVNIFVILNAALENVPKDRNEKMSKEYLRVALDVVAPSAGLPPIGAVEEMDKVVIDACKMMNADDGKMAKEDEFKKILASVLGSIMLQLEGNPISVSTNSVVHEPLASSSTLLQPSA